MKKLLPIICLLFAANLFSQAKSLNLGIHGGITIGDIENRSDYGFGADVNYLFYINDDFDLGPFAGYVNFAGKDDFESRSYLPLGGSIRFNSFDDQFYVGGDLGYAIGLSPSGDRGGILFRPMVGYKITEQFKINLSYLAVKKKVPAYSYIGIGLVFDFLGNDDYYSY